MRIIEAVEFVCEKDVPAHLARERAAGFLHLGLHQAVAGLPHQRRAAERRNSVEQHLRRLHIGDDRRAGEFVEHRFGQNGENLVAPDHPALPVDRADPVTVAVEGQSEIELLLGDEALEIGEVRFFGGIGMMVGKFAVDIGEQQMMLTRQELDELLDDRARNTVAGVPADLVAAAGIASDEAADIIVLDVERRNHAAILCVDRVPIAVRGHLTKRLNVGAEKWRVLQHQLEAVIVGGIMAAGYLDAAIHL